MHNNIGVHSCFNGSSIFVLTVYLKLNIKNKDHYFFQCSDKSRIICDLPKSKGKSMKVRYFKKYLLILRLYCQTYKTK